ncbi:nonstructural protein [Apis mellifera associated microvirus 26]|nr:nonstructural protein [Apis mellifera associated microvirus 26]
MLQKLFAIRDSKTEYFGSPFCKATHGEAERDFRTLVNDEKTNLNQYPEDYDLYYLGEYDNNSGKFETLETPQHLMKAIQVKKQPEV